MPKTVRMVCLANSRKRSGRCVAGKVRGEDGAVRWVRPVSTDPQRGISHQERRMSGAEPKLLDIIELSLAEHQPHEYQTENWLIDGTRRWTRTGRAEWRHLVRLSDEPASLWLNGWSTPHGLNDRVPLERTAELIESLALIRVDRLELRVFAPGVSYGDPLKRVQAVFSWHGVEHRLRVTDPEIEQAYLVRGSTRLTADDLLPHREPGRALQRLLL